MTIERTFAILALTTFLVPVPISAATPTEGTVAEDRSEVTWTGGPFVASNPVGCLGADDPTCDHFYLEVEPPSFSPFVVVVEIDSTSLAPDADDYDLAVYGPDGELVDDSASSGAFERVALHDVPAGTYRVEVLPWAVSPTSTYAGAARLLSASPPPLVSVPHEGGSIFATPTLVDSQLHTGEPSIAVSPVIPADGSRPLLVGDAPWGTSNATSLWWRSRDGGESFELVQDPLAAPRPRPCEEIDGGGDSDTSFDSEGRIYVNDLAALVNITVGVSDDGFQTMRCGKADGSNPLQPIQDRQWIAAAPDADGPGPGVDAYLTFRRGLVDGNPVTETAIQVYETTDGGESYEPVGEIVDFFGFANSKVTQTGNPVVDASDGPRRGTLYQSYYLGSTAKIGRYTPGTGTFESFTVASRLADVGNVFPTLAVDTAGNLYYAWVEGGTFDVLLSTSTDGGESWTPPVRLNPPGDSELAVNPFAVAGTPGRVAVLYNATGSGSNPDGAEGAWHLYVAQSLDALSSTPSFVQYRVTDTPLHFGEICTRGLGCNLSVPEGDRSLLEFNELDVDPLDGSLVFIFADNGRRPQPPLAGDEIPQPYIMFTRQIAGSSMIAGKEVANTLPRADSATDRRGDATYPKAGTTEGPIYPALDLRASRLERTEAGVRVVMELEDLADLDRALQPTYGFGDPRVTQKALWVTRFEIVHHVTVDGEETKREEVYAAGMEIDRVAGGPTFWYGPVGVARNATLSVKRSDYGSRHGTVTPGTLDGDTISVVIPFEAMGLDLETDPNPRLHSVVGFTLVEPEAELAGEPVATYFNNQRTVDATRAYDWSLGGDVSCREVETAGGGIEIVCGWD